MAVAGTQRFAVTLEDNPTARALLQMLPLSLEMPDLNDNEKHVRLSRSLPTSAARPGTIRTGDVMLYGNDTLVVFYKTFPSSYSYTRIGHFTQLDGLVEALGPGSRRVGLMVLAVAFGRRVGSLFLTETQRLNRSGPAIHDYPLLAGSSSSRLHQEAAFQTALEA